MQIRWRIINFDIFKLLFKNTPDSLPASEGTLYLMTKCTLTRSGRHLERHCNERSPTSSCRSEPNMINDEER